MRTCRSSSSRRATISSRRRCQTCRSRGARRPDRADQRRGCGKRRLRRPHPFGRAVAAPLRDAAGLRPAGPAYRLPHGGVHGHRRRSAQKPGKIRDGGIGYGPRICLISLFEQGNGGSSETPPPARPDLRQAPPPASAAVERADYRWGLGFLTSAEAKRGLERRRRHLRRRQFDSTVRLMTGVLQGDNVPPADAAKALYFRASPIKSSGSTPAPSPISAPQCGSGCRPLSAPSLWSTAASPTRRGTQDAGRSRACLGAQDRQQRRGREAAREQRGHRH